MNRLARALTTIALAFGCWLTPGQAAAQPQRILDRTALVRQAAALTHSNYIRYVRGEGPCQTGDASPGARTIWAATLGCIQTPSPTIYTALLLPVMTSGAGAPNAKVVATFVVSQVLGAAHLFASAHIPNSTATQGSQGVFITKPGTYTVTGKPFTMQANQPYHAAASVYMLDKCESACAVVARVTDLRWAF